MSIDPLNRKTALMSLLLAEIDAKFALLTVSAQAAVDAATSAESKPENKYDTRALEASYLAGAQNERLRELTAIRQVLAAMPLKLFEAGEPAGITAVLELDHEGNRSWCFLLQFAAGYVLALSDQERVQTVTVESPLGRALMGKVAGDLVVVTVAGKEKEYEVISVY